MDSINLYKPLPVDDELGDAGSVSTRNATPRTNWHARTRNWLLIFETSVLFFVLLAWTWSRRGTQTCQLLYSPAQEAVRYKVVQWIEEVRTTTIYRGEPSEEVDQAWEDLYNDFGISQIPEWQADLLPNPTLPFPDDPKNYIIQLSVFHQMHCLNIIRKALRPEHYIDPITGDLGIIKQDMLRMHLNHCVDSLRQHLMCAGDISPVVWQWNDQDDRAHINMDVLHTCRDFDMIVDWAKAHKSQDHFNTPEAEYLMIADTDSQHRYQRFEAESERISVCSYSDKVDSGLHHHKEWRAVIAICAECQASDQQAEKMNLSNVIMLMSSVVSSGFRASSYALISNYYNCQTFGEQAEKDSGDDRELHCDSFVRVKDDGYLRLGDFSVFDLAVYVGSKSCVLNPRIRIHNTSASMTLKSISKSLADARPVFGQGMNNGADSRAAFHSFDLSAKDEPICDLEPATYSAPTRRADHYTRVRDWLLAIETILLITGSVLWLQSARSHVPAKHTCQLLYSPAEEVVEYEVKQWQAGIWEPTIYEGKPSDKLDRVWSDLYNDFGVSQIPQWQADLLPNPTAPFDENPEYCVMQLTVFHQLHCLNTIRKALRPEHYVNPVTGDLDGIKKNDLRPHIDHCVDSLRQGIMCAADISPIVWHWSDADQGNIINLDIVHSCRNYDSVVTWAKEHRAQYHFNQTGHKVA
ncbi:hypothetical protein NM688_g4090 [Phlebia brevispora]|uniref:Uncharacterized protein n=1 Tax=Phlebia brevispora TaxID=194682 RepID=A0ACC1T3W9_9APHY|nr:hypothetical protein NM688_g4090 [Phlebia brevispora]